MKVAEGCPLGAKVQLGLSQLLAFTKFLNCTERGFPWHMVAKIMEYKKKSRTNKRSGSVAN